MVFLKDSSLASCRHFVEALKTINDSEAKTAKNYLQVTKLPALPLMLPCVFMYLLTYLLFVWVGDVSKSTNQNSPVLHRHLRGVVHGMHADWLFEQDSILICFFVWFIFVSKWMDGLALSRRFSFVSVYFFLNGDDLMYICICINQSAHKFLTWCRSSMRVLWLDLELLSD